MRKSPRLLAALLALLCTPSTASVPIHLPVQGTLADNAGQPVADGAFMMTFSLYDLPDATEAVWSETWPPGEADCAAAPDGCIAVSGGVFSAQLGTHEPLAAEVFSGGVFSGGVFSGGVFSGGGLWLGIAVEGEPELPRVPVGAVPFAWRAALATGLACTGCVSADALSDAARAALADEAVTAVEAAAGPLDGGQLPADGLDDVSNGVLTNTFMATFESPTAPIEVTDLWPPGVSDIITLPPMGALKAVWVTVDLDHEAPEETLITLSAPGGSVFVLHDHGPGDEGGITRTWGLDDPLAQGDLSELVGTDVAGAWTLTVVDDAWSGGGAGGTLAAWSVQVKALSTDTVEVRGDVEITGTLTLTGEGDLQARTNLPLVPPGMIAMFEGDCPPGWAEVEAPRQRFPMGWDGEGPLETGGSATAPHTHGVGSACGPGDCIDWAGGYSGGFAAPGSTGAAEPSIIPPFHEVVFCRREP